MREISEILGKGMNEGDLLSRISRDFKFFYEEVIGFNEKGGLNEYKKEWFNLAYDHDYVMIKAPSGFAKTTVLGVAFPIWWMITHPNTKILLISKTLTQSKDALLLQIRDLIDENVFLKKLLKPDDRDALWNQTQIKTLNGCMVTNRPYSISIKGYRAHIIILDEIDSYEDPNIFFDHVLSRLIPGGKIIGISTPEEGTSTLMSLIKLREMGNKDCIFKTYRAIVDCKVEGDYSTGRSIWPEEYPVSELMIRLGRFGKQKWMKNYQCFEGKTLVQTIKGLKKIKEIKVGDHVLTHEGKYKEVTNTFIRDYSGRAIEISQYGCNEKVLCTPNHLILTQTGWKKAENLTKKDRLAHPVIKQGYEKQPYPEESLSAIIGIYLAEGSIGAKDYAVNFGFNKKERVLIEEVKQHLKNIGLKPKTYEGRTALNVYVNSRKLVRYLESNFGRTKGKHLTRWVYGQREEFKRNLLHYYELGDGCLEKTGCRITTVCLDLMNDISNLYMSVEIIPSKSTQKNWANGKQQYIEGRKINCSKDRYITKTYSGKSRLNRVTKDYIYYRCKGIREVSFKGEVFNLEVIDHNSYTLQGFSAHNCDAMTEGENSIFSASSIEACKNYHLSFTSEKNGEEIYIGCDYALSSSPTGDFDAYVVIGKKGDKATIKFGITKKGIPVDEKIRYMEYLHKKYKPVSFICDKSGIGTEIIRQGRIKGLPIEEQGFTSGERNDLLNNLKSLLDSHKIVIPKERDDLEAIEFANKLEYELFSFVEITSRTTNHTSYVSKGSHDDSLCSGTSIITKTEMIKDIEDIMVGEEVLTHKGNYKKVVSSMSKECERDIITIKPYGGLPISVTDNHKIMVVERENKDPLFRKSKKNVKIIEVNSQEISKDKHLLISPVNKEISEIKFVDLKDYIPTTDGWECTSEHIWNYRWKDKRYKRFIPIDKDFCFFIGHFAGDGCYQGDIAFHKNHKELKNKIRKTLESYGINVREYPQDNNKASLEFCCIPFQNFLKKNIKTRLDKQIPDFCMFLEPILQKEIFEGYRLADGSMVRKMIITATISKKLAYQMKYILLRNNIIASMRKIPRKRYNKITLDQYWLELNTYETNKYLENKLATDFAKSRLVGDYLISTIHSIKKERKLVDVYDIQVEDDFSFVAEGIAIHNSVMGLAMAVKHVQLLADFEDYIGVSPGASAVSFVETPEIIIPDSSNKSYSLLIKSKK